MKNEKMVKAIKKEHIGCKCVKGNVLELCSSNAGMFVGTYDIEDGIPYPGCRMSVYFEDEHDLEQGVIVRECVENDFCNGGKCCLTAKGE